MRRPRLAKPPASRSTGTKRPATASIATIAASPTLSLWLTVVLGALCVLGLVMVGSASSVVSTVYYGSPWAIFFRECLWLVVGVAAFLFAAGRGHATVRRLSGVAAVVAVGLLVVVLAPGLGTSSFGASRWLGEGYFRIQPSELAKFALCLYAAYVISKKERVETEWGRVLRPLAIVTIVCAVLVLVQPDMGTAIVLVAIALAVATASGAPWRALVCTLGLLVLAAVAAGIALPYRRERLLSFLNPLADPSGSGYQVIQSKIALGTGGISGVGLSKGPSKWGLLPNPHTDFIFSVIGQELGLVGTLCTIALLVTLVMLGLRVAATASDRFGQLVAVGVSMWLATETIVNIGGVIGVLPVTGIPLPFISFGGTSLVIDMAAVGVLVGVARQSAARPALRMVSHSRSEVRAVSRHLPVREPVSRPESKRVSAGGDRRVASTRVADGRRSQRTSVSERRARAPGGAEPDRRATGTTGRER